ncbi:MAG: preprotein translocase subunit SecY [Candidatus Pacebacteria bacterium]|nr:preprotein translocase subunit SecY [Candidatus Paceibacterota bacterium]MDD5545237.1 preprotein translocase subunit SecY [Candidatus Paceibacterota bacterium]
MFKNLVSLLKVPDLRRKLLIVFFLLFVFRVLATIPLPNVNKDQLKIFLTDNQFFGLFNVFTGGAFDNISLGLLGIGPYITSSIIFQLLTLVFPSLKEMIREGTDKERAKFEQYQRLLAVPLALLQGFGFLNTLRSQGVIIFNSPFDFIRSLIIVMASSMFIMWLAELITEQKLGNGASMIIFAGIVINFPREIFQTIITATPEMIPSIILFFILGLLIIVGVVFISRGERRIPVSYAKQVRGTKIYGGASTYLPLRINQAGVIPIIFALSIMSFPQMISQFMSASKNIYLLKIALILKNFRQESFIYLLLYFLLVIVFTFFYTMITFEPQSISDNLQKRGGFIPGYRPGKVTSQYLSNVSQKITIFGAIFLGIIALLPILMQKFTGITTFAIGGTSLLIMVEVAIEIMNNIESQLIMREYEIS